MSRESQAKKFAEAYEPELLAAVNASPDEYPWHHNTTVSTVVERMRLAFIKGSYNHDGKAIKATCKKLGIKHTRQAIEWFLELQ